jgi:hypothetical protein
MSIFWAFKLCFHADILANVGSSIVEATFFSKNRLKESSGQTNNHHSLSCLLFLSKLASFDYPKRTSLL